jgi:serine/threonine protein kinase
MNEFNAEGAALTDYYEALTELDRRAGMIRYSATFRDTAATGVVVITLTPELVSLLENPDNFLATIERASKIRFDSLCPPLSWGRTRDGGLHVAYARAALPLQSGSLSPADVATVGARLARDLAGAHEARLVHGAITPDRIGRSSNEEPVLRDIGLFAALRAAGLNEHATSALSDPAHVSPEQEAGQAPDVRSDVYALGATLYELLTGKAPHGGRTTSYVMASVLPEKGQSEASSGPASAVVEALLRSIERAPDDRWASMSAFANALTPGTGRAVAADARASRRPGCLPTAAAIAGVLLALARYI